jgi:MYXO-CTERM domain-containing protein
MQRREPVKNAIKMACGLLAWLVLGHAQAGGISDTGVSAYWGADDHGYGDVIGGSTYDIQGATITRVGNVLTIVIATSFAGHAGMDSSVTAGGVGYGDVFLADTWNAYGTDSHHEDDSASTGTVWDYGFVLDNRYSNTGGTFKLYSLNGATNALNIKNSESYMKCDLGSECWYREGQETGVKTTSSTVSYTGLTGSWSVTADKALTFTIDLSGSELLNYTSFAMHWGETCQNDVIEGITQVVPAPGSAALLVLGLGALALVRRRRNGPRTGSGLAI